MKWIPLFAPQSEKLQVMRIALFLLKDNNRSYVGSQSRFSLVVEQSLRKRKVASSILACGSLFFVQNFSKN